MASSGTIPILVGLQIYHNHLRPHLGLPNGQTSGEAAGIHIDGDDELLTLIRAAAKAKSKAENTGDRSAT